MTLNFHGIRKKLLLGFAAAVLVAVVVFCALAAGAPGGGVPGGENEERVRFLASCGWQVDAEPLAVQEVQIPAEFSDVYERYSEINEQAGFDLHAVAGKACRQYRYRVTNYQGEEAVYATLLTCDSRIVGGDVASAAMDGFMLPLRQQGESSG